MIDINIWVNNFLQTLEKTFENRIWFVGLQGSYGRGEANETSDIDMVVILDEIFAADIQTYSSMLDALPNREYICGFFSGKNELLNWEASELFQFYYDTKPIKGSLDELLMYINDSTVDRAIKTGACNVYHGCVHNMLHEKDENILRNLYKSASFTIQAICFKQTGKYFSNQKDLFENANEEEQTILKTFWKLKNGDIVDFTGMSNTLFCWAKALIR